MNRIRVISTKIPNNVLGSITGIIEYQNELTTTLKNYPGFITSQSYWLDNSYWTKSYYKDIYNISVWKTKYDWDKWYNSEERIEINKKYSRYIYTENQKILSKKKDFLNIPLL
tara:strand:- start:815 stop:1153 length:339 start_codon:yes stop_codon:yes gene_type:complete